MNSEDTKNDIAEKVSKAGKWLKTAKDFINGIIDLIPYGRLVVRVIGVVLVLAIVVWLIAWLMPDNEEVREAQGNTIAVESKNAVSEQKIENLTPKVVEAEKTSQKARKRSESANKKVKEVQEKDFNGYTPEQVEKLCRQAYPEYCK